ncbi:MAG: hypothetical protein HY070_06645 [Chloroflexi bacterium]|nr:hypothetical protein [Chloroflexota bacterium]
MQNEIDAPARAATPIEHVSLLAGVVMVGLTFLILLDLPSGKSEFSFLGSDANITWSGNWLVAFLLAALTAASVDSIVRTHPRVHLGETRYIFILWILPMLIVITTALLLTFIPTRAIGLICVAATGLILFAVVLGEFFSLDSSERWSNAARVGVNLAVHLVALILFAAIYGLKQRSLFSSPAIALVSGLLALELFRGAEQDFRRTWLFAAAIGLTMGELVWALNYWNLGSLLGGGLLLIFFYVLTGLTQQYLWNRLTRFVMIEFGLIVFGALYFLFWFKPG